MLFKQDQPKTEDFGEQAWTLKAGELSISFSTTATFVRYIYYPPPRYQEGVPGKIPLPSAPLCGCHFFSNLDGLVFGKTRQVARQHPKFQGKVEAGSSQ